LQREGVIREMLAHRSYEKPSERKTREKSEAIRRARKLARKKAEREGLIPDRRKKKLLDARKARQQTTKTAASRLLRNGGSIGPRFLATLSIRVDSPPQRVP